MSNAALARRAAKILEMQRVVWLSPLRGGACLRALWHWQVMAGLEGRRRLMDDGRRMRADRDSAYERERQLKRGLSLMRDERDQLSSSLRAAQQVVQQGGDESAELSHTKRLVTMAASERDTHARLAREAREALAEQQAVLEATTEKQKADKRTLASLQRERHSLLREVAELRADKTAAAAREIRAEERAAKQNAALDKLRSERETHGRKMSEVEDAATEQVGKALLPHSSTFPFAAGGEGCPPPQSHLPILCRGEYWSNSG